MTRSATLAFLAATLLAACSSPEMVPPTTAGAPAALEPVAPEEVGLSSEGLAAATAVLQRHVDDGDIAGAVAGVARRGSLAQLEAVGFRDLERRDPMRTDALFRIYSMNRPITALGILMLHEEGRLDVNDPVQRYLSEFADQAVLRDPSSEDPADTRPRRDDITIAQLLTHTSGIGSRSSRMYTEAGVHSYDQTLEEVVRNVAAVPLFEDPGTQYRYGMSAEVLGRVIEVVSGMPAERFFEERVFEPLGMDDSVWYVDEARRERLATVYRPDAEGRLQPIEMEAIPVTERRALTSTGVGLVTSTMDLLRFAQLFLDGGRVGDRQLIRPETIRMAAENGIPEALLPLPGGAGYWAGSGWTLGGFAVAMDPSTYGHTVSQGEFWWDGSAGTRFWIDPSLDMATVVMAQVSPAGGGGFREAWKTAVGAAVLGPR
jgi:CubicO group peptidase (beta-lactamase class C family)